MSDSTKPPNDPHDRPTLDELPPVNDTEPPPPLIPRGFAQHAMMAAISDVYRAVELLTATADAIARQLDAQEDTP